MASKTKVIKGDVELYMGFDILPSDGEFCPSFENINMTDKDNGGQPFGVQWGLDIPVGYKYIVSINSSQLLGWDRKVNSFYFPGVINFTLGEEVVTEEGISWYFPSVSGEPMFSPSGGKTHCLYPTKGIILVGSQADKDKFTEGLASDWLMARMESEAATSTSYLSMTKENCLLEKKSPSPTRATQLWLCSLTRLTNSLLDQNHAGKMARIPVSDINLFYRVPTIRELIPVSIRVPSVDGTVRLVPYLAYRNSSAWLGKLMDILWNPDVALVDEAKANNKGKVMFSEQFEKVHHSQVQSLLENSLIKVGGKTIDWMYAWTHMSGIEDGEIGMAEEVAKTILQSLLKTKMGKLHKIEILKGLDAHGIGIMNGVRTYGVRQPVSAPGGATIMPIRVVSSLAPIVGVTLATAKSMGGDFDHDLFFGGFTSSEGIEAAGQESAIQKILENISFLQKNSIYTMEGGNN